MVMLMPWSHRSLIIAVALAATFWLSVLSTAHSQRTDFAGLDSGISVADQTFTVVDQAAWDTVRMSDNTCQANVPQVSTLPSPCCTTPTVNSTGGPGTEMTRIINRLGLGSDCQRCKALAAEMDQGGVAWVQQNREAVIQRTISNAENLGHRMGPARRVGVRVILNRSIRRSR